MKRSFILRDSKKVMTAYKAFKKQLSNKYKIMLIKGSSKKIEVQIDHLEREKSTFRIVFLQVEDSVEMIRTTCNSEQPRIFPLNKVV